MTTKQASSFIHVDEHYIHMEITPSPNNFSYNTEFEFQITSMSNEKETSSSSLADKLFHKGKLLPLHLLNSSINASLISPSESACMPITELISPAVSDEYHEFVWKPWSKKLKQIKQLWLGQKLKAEGGNNYVKSWFRKYGCLDKSCASEATERKWKNPFEIVDDKRHKILKKTINRNKKEEACGGNGMSMNKHRRSFSGVIRHSDVTKASCGSLLSSSSSSSFSLSSSSRSSNANSERESWIEGAIAHCKKSQQKLIY